MNTLHTSPIEYGPNIEQTFVSAGLDYYKPTMSQFQYEYNPGTEVQFTFKNRGNHRLADFVGAEALQARLDYIRERSWAGDELEYLKTIRCKNGDDMFSENFIHYLRTNTLPEVSVRLDEQTDDLAIETSGDWALVTFWETIIMSEVNELYFEEYLTKKGLDLFDVYNEGDRRLSEKIAVLQANPDIKFADFGTRRRFSLRWQQHVNQRLQTECQDNFTGTSNVALAQTLGLKPIGTFAHEMPMVRAGLADANEQDIMESQGEFLDDWLEFYGEDLATALSDTFGTEFFFSEFTADQANAFAATRHDSGDPFEYGENVIKFYEYNGIDPNTKTIVFSDGLDLGTILALQSHFRGRIKTSYGWGTTLTNDLGLPALNIVMKATHVKTLDGNEADLVKLSDVAGKHTGPKEKVKEYIDAAKAKSRIPA